MFPYECSKCGGGYKRCGGGEGGTDSHDYEYCEECEEIKDNCNCKNIYFTKCYCEGGQFCWEQNVMVNVNGKWNKGIYEGYGYVIINASENRKLYDDTKGEKVFPLCFSKYWEYWDETSGENAFLVATEIYCLSCYI